MQPPVALTRTTSYLPWIIAFLEGFSTLAVEVIAIRLAIPVVGSSMTLTGVMLGVVLFALSAGYWRGGALSARWDRKKTRTVLSRNLLLAGVLYGAVAFPLEARLIEQLLDAGLSLSWSIGMAASALFIVPIYLASQTVPMLAELTNDEGKAGKASGKVLFFSTLGSVAGGIVTPVWLFPSIGVARSGYVVTILLATAACVMAIGQSRFLRTVGAGAAALLLAIGASMIGGPDHDLYHFDSAYQTIRVVEEKGERVMLMSGGRSSGIFIDSGETSFATVRIVTNLVKDTKARNLLVIGAAGFNLPRDASAFPEMERVDAVDVDPAVKGIAETQFLKHPLPAKVHFLPLSARYAARKLGHEGRHYEFAFLDAYFGRGIPEELATVEFFQDVRRISDRVAANVIMDRDLESDFARNLLLSFRKAFGRVWVIDAKPGDDYISNMLVTSWAAPDAVEWNGAGHLYRDDNNTADRDRVRLIWDSE
ncbi:MAG: fused MFS/spermidine synthase [Candidatus Solibacter sp.]